MQQAEVRRPVTVERAATAIGLKPYELLAELIKRHVFLAPYQCIKEDIAIQVAADHGFDLRIVDGGDEEGGSAPSPVPRPPKPANPTGLSSHHPYSDRETSSGDNAPS